jgi:hypothetical protein
LLDVLIREGDLCEAVLLENAIAHVYRIEVAAIERIQGKKRAFDQLRRRLQQKLDGAKILLLIELTNGYLRFTAV